MAIGWRRWQPGVRLRSALAAAAVVAAAFAVGAMVFVHLARADLAGNVDAAARQRATEVVAAVAAGDQDALARTLRPSPEEQTLVQVLDPSGRVEAASAALGDAAPLSPLRPRPGQLLREQRLLPFAGEDPYRIAAAGVADGSGVRTVLVAQSLRPVDESTEAVAAIMAAGLAPMLLVVGAAVFWFVGRSLRPVEAIRRRVAGITARDLHARVPVPGARDEIAALAETMNRMLERLETAAASQRRFVADASHELRSPLATLRAGLDRLAVATSPDGQRDLVELLRRETSRLGDLVADLLLLARIDERGGTGRRDDVDLDDLAYTERDRLAAHRPDLTVRAHLTPVRVAGDAHDLGRALRNLADNAARHARTRVTLNVSVRDAWACVEVTDDGPGVPDADRERIFDRFVRLDDSRTRPDGGSGLGLAITREVVSAHGGHVQVLPGPGMTVRISLPHAVDSEDH
ncbi:HAMP domain-containing sensor histidine kinase [Micromonospora sp. WMMD1128]|uniref:sensor histidine kinase n=1 Tax=unclassified Micromonospora TaxID=2617518 RepID=UPI00248CC180|nr:MULTISPECIES: HAMP domain-containing sensor histidine kinase [unclassified Micromonospora]WBB73925.1 HAMP domain-containing sensor histidine kinase [Micromonospora sp. WMMD1128]WFE32675.1 HAMP domain-containing sensor histidine kinase [Micromonospora sp. WMMD975]